MYKKVPKTVTIAGNIWKVKFVNLDEYLGENDVHGLTIYDPFSNTREILIDKSIESEHGRVRVFLHELIHAIINEAKIQRDFLDESIEEIICESVAEFLAKKKPARLS